MAILAQAAHLPRRQPLHHLGVQVRAARGGREGPPARVAGPRGSARGGAAGRSLADRRAAPDGDAETAELLGAVRDAIADALTPHQRARARRHHAQRRADRRARRAAGHHPRRALQDPARRPPKAARPACRAGARTGARRRSDAMSDRRSLDELSAAARPGRARAHLRGVLRAPRPLRRARARRPRRRRRGPRACAPTSRAAPPAPRTTRASAPC